jgi:hypothetical protein
VGGKSSSPIETRPTLNTNTTNNRNSRLHYRAFRDQGKHKYFPTELFLPIPNYYTVVQIKNIFEIIFLKSKEMIEFAIVTVKTGASVTHWVRYSSIISNSMAESVTNASFVLGADQRGQQRINRRPSVVSTFTSNIATAIVAIQSNSACIINVYLKKCLPITLLKSLQCPRNHQYNQLLPATTS